VVSLSPPPGIQGSRSGPREKAISKPASSKTKNKSSRANGVSALGQSRAGFEVNGKSNGTGHAKVTSNGQSGANSKNNPGKTGRTPSRRSTRSRIAATSENTIDMSARLTTGWDEFATAGDGTSSGAATRNSDAGVDARSYSSNANNGTEANRTTFHFFDDSDDSEPLSSVPSSAFNSPAPEELAVRTRKRSLSGSDIGANGVRESKKSKN
jgi:hypothetical protein